MTTEHTPRQHDDGVGCACGKNWPCPTLRQAQTCLTREGRPKVQYQTRGEARAVARRMRRLTPDQGRLQVYKCRSCDFFHAGHPYGPGAPRR